jgi:hypothetical protein
MDWSEVCKRKLGLSVKKTLKCKTKSYIIKIRTRQSESEIKDFKVLAKVLLSLSSDEIEKLIITGEYKEISYNG